MKTAISLPDELFERADAEARRANLSRSELYARAIERYLADLDDDAITAALDEVYADDSNRLDGELAVMQTETLDASERW